MSSSTLLSRALSRLGVMLLGVVAVGLVGLPAAHAAPVTVSLTLAPGQSASIGRLVSNSSVTPVSTCDKTLSVSFDPTMLGTVTVAPDVPVGSYACSVDFQVAGQPTGLVEQVSVDVVTPSLSINDVALPEGTAGVSPLNVSGDATSPPTTPFTFVVTMSEALSAPLAVPVATVDGTATGGGAASTGPATELPDYTAVNTVLTFPPGTTSQKLTVEVAPDSVTEPNETFFVTLSPVTGTATLQRDLVGHGVILNDDTGPIIAR
ncbi:MAG TPA: Calx-beta domain-containing protein [Mycobacteriales bacterium]|nr:Calx-beta domain-containing protein [Mycobacteriales bacterium]